MPDGGITATLAAGLGLAFLFGLIAHRLHIPSIVGYLVAGVVIGPFTPGFVGDVQAARELADIAVVLLMFGVGLHFSIDDLLAVRRVALPGALIQIAVTTAVAAGLAAFWGWDLGASIVFGLALSVASTVVLLRTLEQRRALDSAEGKVAVGWLVVEDIATVIALVILPLVVHERDRPLGIEIGATVLKVGVFVVLVLVVGRRVIRFALVQAEKAMSRELFTLAVIAIAFTIAFGSAALFDISIALAAFFAGLVVAESDVGERAARAALPLQDVFAVLFFVSVGMLFNPFVVFSEPSRVLAILAIIIVGKFVVAFLVATILRQTRATALIVSSGLAQIGEFSFVLMALGVDLEIVPLEGLDLIVAAAVMSIGINPLLFTVIDHLSRARGRAPFHAASARRLARQ